MLVLRRLCGALNKCTVYWSASRLQEYSSYSRIAVNIYIVVLLTSERLDSIHIVDNIFLYNVPCVENEKVATGLRNGLPYSPIADFGDITSSRNIFCNSGPLHNARSTHLSNSIMTRAISGPLNIHFCRVTGHPVSSTSPPSSFTPALCWSYGLSIARFENAWLVLLTVKYPFRNPAYM